MEESWTSQVSSFSNRSDTISSRSEQPMSTVDSYYYPVEITFPMDRTESFKFNNDREFREFNFAKADFARPNNYILSINWNDTFTGYSNVDRNVNEDVNMFYDILLKP